MTPNDRAAASLRVIVGMPMDILKEDLDEFVTREIRFSADRLATWSAVILAIALAVGYQLLPLTKALRSVTRSARKLGWPRLA
jgi:hypothetical protein